MSMGKWWMGIVCCLVNGALVVGQPSSTNDVDQQPETNDQQESRRDGSVANAPSPPASTETEGQIFAAPPDARETRHIFDAATGEMTTIQDGVASGGNALSGTVVYSNRPSPSMVLAPGAGYRFADDATTVALQSCELSGVELRFAGGGDGTGEGFDVDFALFDGCPDDDGQLIAGSDLSFQFDHDGIHVVLIDFLDAPITIPRQLWIANAFSRDDAGWYVGESAAIGFTDNKFANSLGDCAARFSGTLLYAGFHVRLYAIGIFEREHAAYLNPDISLFESFTPGVNQWLADDVSLAFGSCELTSYELAGISAAGRYTIHAELWEECDPETVIEGTQAIATGVGDGAPDLFQFHFSSGVQLPSDNVWMAWRFDRANVAALSAGPAKLGTTSHNYGLWGFPNSGSCGELQLGGPSFGGFRINVYCKGEAPLGACCDVESLAYGSGDATCRSRQAADCLGDYMRWSQDHACPGTCLHTNDPCASNDDCRLCSESKTSCMTDDDCPSGESCESGYSCGTIDPFNPPCGHHACCTPLESAYGEGCVILPRDECEALVDDEGNQADWHVNRYCDVNYDCPRWACTHSDAFCDAQHAGVGCVDLDICQAVCEMDTWCCEVAWDHVCQRHACEYAEPPCHPTCIIWASPANYTFDARQPHPPGEPANILTPQWIDVGNGPGMCSDCWHAKDSAAGGEDTDIAEIEWINATDRRIHFSHPLPWPARTYVSYWGAGGDCDSVFIATYSPGNVNADGAADLADIEDYIAYLTDGDPWLAYPYRCDIDRSGACNPADLLRIIDLLNGAAGFEPMLGVPIAP